MYIFINLSAYNKAFLHATFLITYFSVCVQPSFLLLPFVKKEHEGTRTRKFLLEEPLPIRT